MRRLLRRILIIGACFLVVFALLILIPFVYVRMGCDTVTKDALPEDTSELSQTVTTFKETIPTYTRPEEKSYLTLPEWYIVYSAHEYADFSEKNLPSHFPFFASIGQYWNTYCRVQTVAKQYSTPATGDHVSLMVIGTSYTVEYALKGFYENTIGRLSELLSFGEMVEEDQYAAQVAQEYARFLHTIPWYEFPFGQKLGGLWKDTSFFGSHFIRKSERKVVLSLEYGVKAVYGGVIRWATHATYGYQDLEIHAVIDQVPPHLFQEEPRLKEVKEIKSGTYLVLMPRYEEFTEIVLKLTQQGVRFIDIAGNDELLLTALTPSDWQADLPAGKILFEMPILTNPEQKRTALTVPVRSLHLVIKSIQANEISIEHVYDY